MKGWGVRPLLIFRWPKSGWGILPQFRCGRLLSLENLPHKQKLRAEIREAGNASNREYDEAIQPLGDGIKKLVDQVRSRQRKTSRRAARMP